MDELSTRTKTSTMKYPNQSNSVPHTRGRRVSAVPASRTRRGKRRRLRARQRKSDLLLYRTPTWGFSVRYCGGNQKVLKMSCRNACGQLWRIDSCVVLRITRVG